MAIKIIKDDKIWMEAQAIDQVNQYAKKVNVINACGLPDLHSGVIPVGVTFECNNMIYPAIIGNDIGCGMALIDTKVKAKKYDQDKWMKKLEDTSMNGTYSIGGGNHFCEVCMIDQVLDKEEGKKLGLDTKKLYILVHSGSRSLGAKIYDQFKQYDGISKDDLAFETYMKLHDEACQFAKENREAIANQLMDYVGIKSENQVIIDCMHNVIKVKNDSYFHHKGSIHTDEKYAIIAGTRGSYSYIVRCKESKDTLYSISHGAGRKWPRALCKGRLQTKYKKEEIKYSKLGSVTVCDKKELLYEEAKEAYKDIEDIIRILKDYDAIEVVARIKPLLTYKC